MVEIGKTSPMKWRAIDNPAPNRKPGQRVQMRFRLANGADSALAKSEATYRFRQILEAGEAAHEYGLENGDWSLARSDGDVSPFDGITYTLWQVELAMIVGDGFKNVTLEGEEAEWSRRNVALLFRELIPGAAPILSEMETLGATFGDRFAAIALNPVREAHEEGKD